MPAAPPSHLNTNTTPVGVFIEDYNNHIYILTFDDETLTLNAYPLLLHPSLPPPLLQPPEQLIAHDKEVYDIAWGEAGLFASASADGSVGIFELRDKDYSTIIYESPETPLLRLFWNKQDLMYMATVLMDNNKILGIRSPTVAVAELERHKASVNAIAWSPRGCRHICSAGDDSQPLIGSCLLRLGLMD